MFRKTSAFVLIGIFAIFFVVMPDAEAQSRSCVYHHNQHLLLPVRKKVQPPGRCLQLECIDSTNNKILTHRCPPVRPIPRCRVISNPKARFPHCCPRRVC